MINVLIGIQARSGNTRLPGKCFESIGDRKMIEHVIDACESSADHINRKSLNHGIHVDVCLVIPEGDDKFKKYHKNIVEGSEADVLSRYKLAVEKFDPKYLVRITADCPLIPSPLITKHIMTCVKHRLDYVHNVCPDTRTMPDGFDCEIMSREVMDYLFESVSEFEDKEHVTTLLRSNPPRWARIAHIIGPHDFSVIKLSVDTKQELERVRTNYSSVAGKVATIKRKGYGVFRY